MGPKKPLDPLAKSKPMICSPDAAVAVNLQVLKPGRAGKPAVGEDDFDVSMSALAFVLSQMITNTVSDPVRYIISLTFSLG